METLFRVAQPEFFDIFGIFVFSFLIFASLWGLKTKKPFPKWMLMALLLIGILGFIVDGIIVFVTYIQ